MEWQVAQQSTNLFETNTVQIKALKHNLQLPHQCVRHDLYFPFFFSFPVLCVDTVSYTHLRAHETVLDLVCRLLLEKKKKKKRRDTVTMIESNKNKNTNIHMRDRIN
eukprot:TRINITY_DN125_c0_g1_i7.p2 TRINITY_DN125_c0_g1~~TRINITY_DN125_c0_g1_i7.p2  ORF type:complete len:107 (-),score=23.08 TRINITY_DN125_c0_g1_i7:41-361(-)